MSLNDMRNLYVGYNSEEDFQILICAVDEEKAKDIANEYLLDSGLDGGFNVFAYAGANLRFDCDYVLS